MIDIPVRVEKVIRHGSRDKSVSYFVALRIDEGREETVVGVSRDVYHQIEAALAGGRRFVMTLQIAPPTRSFASRTVTSTGLRPARLARSAIV